MPKAACCGAPRQRWCRQFLLTANVGIYIIPTSAKFEKSAQIALHPGEALIKACSRCCTRIEGLCACWSTLCSVCMSIVQRCNLFDDPFGGMMCRAEALSSSGVSHVQEEKQVSQGLQGNGYPKGFIHKHTCPQPDQRTPRDQLACGSVTLPYISRLSKSIRRVLAPLAIQVTFRPYRTLRQ